MHPDAGWHMVAAQSQLLMVERMLLSPVLSCDQLRRALSSSLRGCQILRFRDKQRNIMGNSSKSQGLTRNRCCEMRLSVPVDNGPSDL